MTITRHRLIAALALPLSLGLLAACGTDSGTTTTTESAAAAATTTTDAATTSPSAEPSATTSASPDATDASSTSSADPSKTGAAGTESGTTTADGSGGSGGVPSAFSAVGTEPFWDVQVDGRTLTYSGVDVETKVMEAERSATSNTSTYTGTHEGAGYRLVVTVGTCSDGMSDTEYPYKATWTFDGKTEQGCAR